MMYTGPGSGPMLAAATAWQSLAAELNSSATAFQSALSSLTSGWQGPSSTTMASAAEPYVSWMGNTAAGAQQAGAQAGAAAGAFESAFGATVPPPLIEANRALLMALIATNFFGQNSPAIAATEAEYAEFWAQDVGMMNSYALASQQVTSGLQSFSAAPTVANASTGTQSLASAAAATPADASSWSTLFTALETALSSLVQPTTYTTAGLTALEQSFSGIGADLTAALGITAVTGDPLAALVPGDLIPLQAAYYMLMMGSMPARMFMSMGQSAANAGGASLANGSQSLLASVGQLVDGKMQAVVGGVSGQLRSWGSAVSAQLAHSASVGGKLSVPQNWSAAATAMTRAAPVLPATTVASPSVAAPSAGMPGGPFSQALMGALSGRGLSTVAGKAPKVVPRSPAGG